MYTLFLLQLEAEQEGEEEEEGDSGEEEEASPLLGDAEQSLLLALTCTLLYSFFLGLSLLCFICFFRLQSVFVCTLFSAVVILQFLNVYSQAHCGLSLTTHVITL